MHLLHLDSVSPRCLVTRERPCLSEKVEPQQVRHAVRARRSEADRPKDSRQERYIVVQQIGIFQFPLLMEFGHHVQPENIGFAFLERRRLVLERLSHRSLAGQRILDAQPVRHLVEHRVLEEGVEVDESPLAFGDQHVSDGDENLFELRPHRVLELQAPRAFLKLYLLVVGEVDRDCLRPRVAIAGVVDHVVGIQVGIRARRFLLVFVRHGQPALQGG